MGLFDFFKGNKKKEEQVVDEQQVQKQQDADLAYASNLYYSVATGKKKASDLTTEQKRKLYNHMVDTGAGGVSQYDFNEYTRKKYGLERPDQQEEQWHRYGQNTYRQVVTGQLDRNKLNDEQKGAMYGYMLQHGKASVDDFNDYTLKKYKLGQYSTRAQEAKKQAEQAQAYADRNPFEKLVDTLSGGFDNFNVNRQAGELQQDVSAAYYDYMKSQRQEDLLKAQQLQKQWEQFVGANPNVGQGNWLTKDFANYLPQRDDQIVSQGKLGAVVAGIGAVGGGLIGGVPGAIAGAKLGAKVGAVGGSANYGYETMTGAAYQSLLEMGVPNDIAIEVAKEIGNQSAIVEGAETVLDVATLGKGSAALNAAKETAENTAGKLAGKVLGETAEKAFKKKLAEKAMEFGWKPAIQQAGKAYARNLISEGVEEAVQEAISIRGENKAIDETIHRGVGIDTPKTQWTLDDAGARVGEAFAGGFKVAAVGGVSQAGLQTVNTRQLDTQKKNIVYNTIKGIEDVSKNEEMLLAAKNDGSLEQAIQTAEASLDNIQRAYPKDEATIQGYKTMLDNARKRLRGEAVETETTGDAETDAPKTRTRAVASVASAQKALFEMTAKDVNLSTAESRTETENLVKDATGYGEQGVRTFTDLLSKSENTTAKELKTSFQRAYEDGFVNRQRNTSSFKNEVESLAYQAGQADAQTSLTTAKGKQSTLWGNKGEYVNQYNSYDAKTNDKLTKLAKATGVRIVVDSSMVGKQFNGSYNNGVITISPDATDPVLQVVRHELTHHLEQVAPEAYASFRNYVMQRAGDNSVGKDLTVTEQKRELYGKLANQNLSTEGSMQEIVAQFAEKLISDERAMTDFVNEVSRNTETRTWGQKIFDAIRDFIERVKKAFGKDAKSVLAKEYGMSLAQLEKAEQLWKDTVKSAVRSNEQAQNTSNKADTEAQRQDNAQEVTDISEEKNADTAEENDENEMFEDEAETTDETQDEDDEVDETDMFDDEGKSTKVDDAYLFEDEIPQYAIKNKDVDRFYNSDIKYSIKVTDKETLKFLNEQKTITTYKAMQIIDGNLYPPMAAKVKDENGKYQLTNPAQLGEWQQATEDTANIKKFKNGIGYYVLNKGNGKTVEAAYNPYEHSSNLVLNDQFEEAYQRDNLVVVECQIPESEMKGEYKAQYAKDSTGMMDWKAGVVAGKIKNNKRKVYLSRWLKPVRILSNAEVALKYKEVLDGTGVAVPFNVVQPALLTELEKVGITIDYDGSPQYKSIQARKAEKANAQYSLKAMDADYLKAVEDGDMETVQKLVDEAAKKAGYPVKAYHGSDQFGFTKFNPRHSDDGISLFFTDSSAIAKSYTSSNEVRSIGKPWKDTADIKAKAEQMLKQIANDDIYFDGDVYKSGSKYIIESYAENTEGQYICKTAAEFLDKLEMLQQGKSVGGVYDAYLKVGKTLEVDAEGHNWDRLDFNPPEVQELLASQKANAEQMRTTMKELKQYAEKRGITLSEAMDMSKEYARLYDEEVRLQDEYDNWMEENKLASDTTTRDIARYAKKHGYDSVTIRRVADVGKYDLPMELQETDNPMHFKAERPSEESTVYILFNADQVKSADPVTYDDNGDVIPLSERFNTNNDDIRYAIKIDYSEMSEDGQAIVKRLREQATYARILTGRFASMTPERFTKVYGDSFAKGNPDYASAYIAWVKPNDFVYATTTGEKNREQLRTEAGELDLKRLQGYDQAMWLTVNKETGDIVGHEGRHRMLALEKAGVEKVAVLIKFVETEKQNSQPIDSMKLKGQKFSFMEDKHAPSGSDFYLHDALPLSERYGKAAYQLFCMPEKDGAIRYSLKDNPATYEGKPFWSGSVNLLDGQIEEVHAYEEAEQWGFHHSLYFSPAQVEKMDNGESAFFWVQDGRIEGEWRDSVPNDILKKIESQIEITPHSKKQYSVKEYGTDTVNIEADGGDVQWSIKSMRFDINDGKMKQDLIDHKILTKREADQLMDNIDKLIDKMLPFANIVDMNEVYDKDDRPFSPYKPNSDPLYKVSLDFSTLCKKRLMNQFIIESLQAKLGRALTATEQVAIRSKLLDYQKENDKIQVYCALCYVEARRLKAPDQINRFLYNRAEIMTDYFAKKNGDYKKQVEEMANKMKVELGYEADTALNDMKPADKKKINTAKQKMNKEYQPSADELELIKVAEQLENKEFLTQDGLTRMALDNHTIYDAFVSFVRNATKSKALESGVPYYYGDSKSVSDTLIEAMNEENGLRHQSWSDFEVVHLLDTIAAVIELSVRKAKVQAYTKVPGFVDVVGKTGIMINLSLIPDGKTGMADGELTFSPVEGMDYATAIDLRDKYSKTAGTIAIGINDKQIEALLNDPSIDYVIPYHTSGMNAKLRQMAKIAEWENYEPYQSEKPIAGRKNDNDNEQWHKKPNFSEWFDTTKLDMSKSGIEIMREAAQRYLDLCEERGLAPKFSKSKGGTDFSQHDDYWKLLIDRKMIDNEGNIIIQQAVRPEFDFDSIWKVVQEEIDNYDATLYDTVLEKLDKDWKSGAIQQREQVLQRKEKAEKVAKKTTSKKTKALKSEEAAAKLANSLLAEVVSDDGTRHSLKNDRDILKENAQLKQVNEELKRQFRLTKIIRPDDKELKKFTKELLKSWDSQADQEDIQVELGALYTAIANNKDQTFSFDDAYETAHEIADRIVQEAVAVDDTMYQELSELRDYLRKTSISISAEDVSSLTGYDSLAEFKKKYRGRIKITKDGLPVDVAFGELASMFPGHFNEEATTHPAEQLLRIAKVLDEAQPTEHNPYSSELRSATIALTQDILHRLVTVGQRKPTFADKAKLMREEAVAKQKLADSMHYGAKIAKMQREEEGKIEARADEQSLADEMYYGAKLAEQQRKNKAKTKEKLADQKERYNEKISDLRETHKAKTEVLKDTHREKMALLRQTKNAKIDELIEEHRTKMKEVLVRERTKREEAVAKVRDKYREREKKMSERQKAAALRKRIERHVSALSTKLFTNSDKQHIPEPFKKVVAKLLESVNLESNYQVDPVTNKHVKDGTGVDTKRTAIFKELKAQYAQFREDGEMVLDPDLFDSENFEGLLSRAVALGDTPIISMNSEQLTVLWETIRTVEHSIHHFNEMLSITKYQRVSETAQAMQKESSTRKMFKGSKLEKFRLQLENPLTFFSHFGEAGEAVYRGLREAQDKQQTMLNEVQKIVGEIVKPDVVEKLNKTTLEYTTTGGQKLTLTTAQIMEIYELSKRPHAVPHLTEGGIRQPEIKHKHIKRGKENNIISESDIKTLTNKLSDSQKEIADKLQKVMATTLADYGNEASMKAYGYKKFTEKEYYPIKSAREGIRTEVGGPPANANRSIANIGFAKSLTPKAHNALNINSIFTTFANHTGDMVDYSAWLCPMEDANRLYNYKFKNADGKKTKTFQDLLEDVCGNGGSHYYFKLMGDIQNGLTKTSESVYSETAEKLVRNAKAAAVGANIRVVLQQPTALLRASKVLGATDMMAGIVAKPGGWKTALKHSPIAQRKAVGGFDVSSPSSVSEMLFDDRTSLQKWNDTMMKPAAWADALAWGRIWRACESNISRKTNLSKGSNEFYEAVNALFNEVIDKTQVVDGVLQRTHAMRDANALMKQMTSFMGEPSMTLNMILRDFDAWSKETDVTKKRKARHALSRSITAVLAANTANAIVQSIVDGWRDDDDEKDYRERVVKAFSGLETGKEEGWDKFFATMSGNFGSSFNPLTYVPIAKDVVSIAQGYDVVRMDADIMADVITAFQAFMDSVNGEGTKTVEYNFSKMVHAISKSCGISTTNVVRDVAGLTRTLFADSDLALQYELEKAIYKIDNKENNGKFYDLLYQARKQNDTVVYNQIVKELTANGTKTESIKSAMTSRTKKEKEAAKK